MTIKNFFFEGPILLIIIRWMLSLCLVVSFFFALNEEQKKNITNILKPKKDRVILSTVNGDLLNNGEQLKVIKVKLENKLFIEVYSTPKDGVRNLFSTIQLPDSRDGYFQMGSSVTNLALKDVDNDQMLEIIVPTFDSDLKGRLNIYDYNLQNQAFEVYNGPINP